MVISENGWSCSSSEPAAAARDEEQLAYLRSYTEQVRLALGDGVAVRGYFGWSLLDGFEWTDGFSKRFGLFHVDRRTQRRTPRRAARWWNETRRCAETGGGR